MMETKVLEEVFVKDGKQYDIEWEVLILDDDFTTFDFVIDLLVTLFNKDPQEAKLLAEKIDVLGEGVAGRYSYETACTKALLGTQRALAAGFPLELKVRPGL